MQGQINRIEHIIFPANHNNIKPTLALGSSTLIGIGS